MTEFPWRSLRHPLTDGERQRVSGRLRALVRWQRTLRSWPRGGQAPAADPFVSLYVAGNLHGCFGSGEGSSGERLARAFLLAAGDPRFPPIAAHERARVVAQASYCLRPRFRRSADISKQLEIGVDGVAIALPDGRRTAVLPDVARDQGMSAAQFLAAARAKLGLENEEAPRATRYFTFETSFVTSRLEGLSPPQRGNALAARWLARQIRSDGSIAFGLDPRTGESMAAGKMFHGRSASVLEALYLIGTEERSVARARRWLGREIERGLRGAAIDGWPDTPAMVAGTLALALRAGIDVRSRLTELAASTSEIASSPWHAGQVVAALGRGAPKGLWSACVADLARNPVAPWTLLGAIALGDNAVRLQCETALLEAIRPRGPHAGGVMGAAVPELALTAMAVTALRASSTSRRVLDATERASAFLRRWQFIPGAIPGAFDPDLSAGAFPLSPVHSWLRADVTAHALMALAPETLGGRRPTVSG